MIAAGRLQRTLILTAIMAIAMMVGCVAPAFAGTFLNSTDDITIGTETSHRLATGVTEGVVTLNKSGGSSVKAHVILVKADARAKLKPIIPGYYTSGSTKASRASRVASWSDSSWSATSLSKMVAQYESAADTSSQPVLAAINGDFGTATTGNAPRGSVILEGNKEMAHSRAFDDEFFFGYKDNGVVNIVQRTTAQKGDFSEAITGAAYILRNGKLFGVDNENEARQRTGVAYKPNGDILLIAVESGISVKQLAKLMKASGCWNGLNMDGGGSTTMVTKRRGESTVSLRTPRISTAYADRDPDNGQRRIQSGLMVVADNRGPANNVPAGNGVIADKDTYHVGDPIYVTAYGNADGAWVSLLKANDTDNATSYYWYYIYGDSDAGTWCWENGATYNIFSDGVCNSREGVTSSASLSPGNYRLVLLKGNYEKLAECPITITEKSSSVEYSLSTNKPNYREGEDIKFCATAPVSKTWVGLFKNGDSIPGDASYFFYTLKTSDQNRMHVLNRSGGSVTEHQRADHSIGSTLPAGSYKVILCESYDGETAYSIKAQRDITIDASTAVHTVTWKNEDGTVLDEADYDYGTKAEDIELPEEPTKEATAQYTYTFEGWTPDVEDVTGDATYTANYTATVNKYTVAFKDEDGRVLEEADYDYGTKAEDIELPEEPTKEATAQYTYTFKGWTPDVKDVTGDATYTASYTATVNKYTVAWKNDNDAPLETDQNIPYGRTPNYDGATPEKQAYTYSYYLFDGWTPEIGDVVGDASYTATYKLFYNIETDKLTLKDQADIKKLRDQYEDMSPAEKESVINPTDLVLAEKTLEVLQAEADKLVAEKARDEALTARESAEAERSVAEQERDEAFVARDEAAAARTAAEKERDEAVAARNQANADFDKLSERLDKATAELQDTLVQLAIAEAGLSEANRRIEEANAAIAKAEEAAAAAQQAAEAAQRSMEETARQSADRLEQASADAAAKIAVMKQQVKGVKVKAKKDKKVTVKWRALGTGYSYEVYISKSLRKGYKRTTVTDKLNSTVKKTGGKKLKAKRTYYVKVRAFRVIGNEKVYTAFSEVTKVKVKK